MLTINKHKLSDVQLSLSGFIKVFPNLVFYTNFSSIRRKFYNAVGSDVKLITGGGSGHEPAHVGYVGQGMLHAAVCGDIYASPSVDRIVNTILSTSTPQSDVLMIVKNYTGDRLNFGLAIETVKVTYNFNSIQMLLVDDDCSIDQKHVKPSVGRRGLAGVVLIHKIAGAMSELQLSGQQIYSTCRDLLEHRKLITIGFSFTSTANQLTNIEIGKGIHGEPGVMTIENSDSFQEVIDICLKKFAQHISSGSQVCVMINNLGGTSLHLVNIFSHQLLEAFSAFGYIVEKVMSGSFLSSLKQEGLSVTLLDVSTNKDELIGYLNYPVNVPAGLFNVSDKSKDSVSMVNDTCTYTKLISDDQDLTNYVKYSPIGVEMSKTALIFISEALASCEGMLNTMDSELGDGDTGITLSKGAAAINQHIQENKINFEYPAVMLQQLAKITRDRMGGSSGAVYALFFQAGASEFTDASNGKTDMERWRDALTLGTATITRYALSNVGDRTMLDPLKAGEVALQQATGKSVLEMVEEFTVACEKSAAATVNMQPRSGRAAYSSTKTLQLQYPDPGAHAVGIWSRAMFEAVKTILAKQEK